MNPAVSVVMAAYNYGRFLAGAIDSVVAQSCGDWELLVIDDGSTDDTTDVVRRYASDPRIHVQRTDHLGQPRAKNAGIRLARAPLIAFLDADDLWLPSKLDRQLALFDSDRELGVVGTRRFLIDAAGNGLTCNEAPLHRGWVLREIFRDNFLCFSSVMVRRAVFDAVGWFDESIPMAIDYDLWLRAALAFRFDYVDEPLVRYRVGHANLSRRIDERMRIVEGIMRRFLDDRGGREALGPALVRRAWAETYCNKALIRRDRDPWGALRDYARALTVAPGHLGAWKGLIGLAVPEAGRRLVRQALGRPADWRRSATIAPAPGNVSPILPRS